MRKNQLISALFLGLLGVCAIPFFVYAVGTRFDIKQTNRIPKDGPYIIINNGNTETDTRKVTIQMRGPKHVTRMRISNTPQVGEAPWQTFSAKKEWFLDFGRGEKIVYVQFETKRGEKSITYADSILLSVAPNPYIDVTLNNGEDTTFSRYITVSSTVSKGVEHMQISNTSKFTNVPWISIEKQLSWTLTSKPGKKTVYIRFRDAQGRTFVKKETIRYTPSEVTLDEGSLVQTPQGDLYYYGFDGHMHPFSSLAVYHSWFDSFDNIQTVSAAEISRYPLSEPVSVRPGSWLVRFGSSPTVYGVEPGYRLRPFWSDAEKTLLYGDTLAKRTITLSEAEREHYTVMRLFDPIVTKNTTKKDDDKDGLEKTYELQYGSSDKSKDTDGDGLSDFEEIRFWLSDPTIADTDGDGVSDATELTRFDHPLGGSLRTIPEYTYTYPVGTVIETDKTNAYYLYTPKQLYRSISAKTWKTSPVYSGFSVSPRVPIQFGKTGSSSSKDRDILFVPTIYRGGTLQQL